MTTYYEVMCYITGLNTVNEKLIDIKLIRITKKPMIKIVKKGSDKSKLCTSNKYI